MGRRLETLAIIILLLIIGLVYWSAIPPGSRILSRQPSGYYGLLTEAFLHGQLHLRLEPDPRLLALNNPYAGPQGVERPHDMSYYQDRFYLYYGATPALLLYLPWRIVTGTYLGEALGAVLLLYGGVLLGSAWLIAARRRWFPHLPGGWLLLMLAMFGFAPPLLPEAASNTFYIVPIAGAFFCLMAAFVATSLALTTSRIRAQAGWLALASLAWGCAVGARPVYVAGLLVLAVPAGWLWWRTGRESRWRWPGLQLLGATVVPAALVGLALMTYNYLRFDDPFDFGIRYSLASGDLREARLVGPEFVAKNLSLYLFEARSVIRYAPFLIPDANAWGLVPHLTIVLLGLLFPLSWRHPPLRDARWILTGVLLAGTAVANLGLLSLFFGEQERYLLDFSPPLLLLASFTALAVLDQAGRLRSALVSRSVRWLVAALALYAVASGFLFAMPRHHGLAGMLWLERLLNIPTHLIERLDDVRHGPVEMEVRFPRDRIGVTEPLLTAGFGGAAGDAVLVRYLDEHHVRFQAFHSGRGGPVSEPIRIDFDRVHRLRLAMGSLYPPRGHPVFAGWPDDKIDALRRRLKVELDGRPVLRGSMSVYPSTPSALLIGGSHLNPDVSTQAFSGEILSAHRLGVDPDAATGYESGSGPVRMVFRLPPRVGDEGLPLIATGRLEGGDLIFVQMLGNGRVRFGHDGTGTGAVFSPAVIADLDADQVLEVEMGSLYPAGTETEADTRSRLRVRFNGTLLIDTIRPFYPATHEEVEFGFNTIRASSAIEYFPGTLRRIERVPPQPVPDIHRQWGPLRLAVRFPVEATDAVEPLLTTGRTGRGDVLFVRYEPDGALRFGHDHWGVGADLSEPVQLDRSEVHFLEIHSPALLPSAPAGLELRIDGRTIFRSTYTPYRAEQGEIHPGENPIGASSCVSKFTGAFLLQERLPW